MRTFQAEERPGVGVGRRVLGVGAGGEREEDMVQERKARRFG